MANSLEFKISADDQASRVVETVQGKIQNFGRDIAKMALGFAGPFALVQMGIQAIASAFAEAKKEAEDLRKAQEEAAAESAKRVTSKEAGGTDVKSKAGLEIDLLNKKAQMLKDIAAQEDKDDAARISAAEYYLNYTKAGRAEVERDPNSYIIQELAIASVHEEAKKIELERKAAQERLDNEKKILAEKAKQKKDTADQLELARRITSEANQFNKSKADSAREVKQASNELAKAQSAYTDALKKPISVSSLREMGGGVSGESAAISAQLQSGYSPEQQQAITAAQEALSAAKTNSDAAIKFSASVDTFSSSVKNISSSGNTGDSIFVNPSPTANNGN